MITKNKEVGLASTNFNNYTTRLYSNNFSFLRPKSRLVIYEFPLGHKYRLSNTYSQVSTMNTALTVFWNNVRLMLNGSPYVCTYVNISNWIEGRWEWMESLFFLNKYFCKWITYRFYIYKFRYLHSIFTFASPF